MFDSRFFRTVLTESCIG